MAYAIDRLPPFNLQNSTFNLCLFGSGNEDAGSPQVVDLRL
jgi:hypothetical protein